MRAPSPSEFLTQFDAQMHTAVQGLERNIREQMEAHEADGAAPVPRLRRDDSTVSDWRVFALAVVSVVLMSLAGFYFFDQVRAPEPLGHGVPQHDRGAAE